MNRQQAKAILEMYRAGGQDDNDPEFAEALALARQDAELAAWFARQRAFDAMMSRGLQGLAVPAQLQESLLAEKAALPASASPSAWRRIGNTVSGILNMPIIPEKRLLALPLWRQWPARVAALTTLLLLVISPALFSQFQPGGFARYLNDIVAATWDPHRHVDLRTNNLAYVRQWLKAQDVDSTFEVPQALQHITLHGARVLHWNGRKVAFLCYLDGPQHLHFLVSDLTGLAHAPPPKNLLMAECHRWVTFSWVHNRKAYVLTGLRMKEFINRFRKDGQWLFQGEPARGQDQRAFLEYWANQPAWRSSHQTIPQPTLAQ